MPHAGRETSIWAVEGATAAGAVTAAFWFGIGGGALGFAAVVVAFLLGARVGVAAGSGVLKDAWRGSAGAVLIPALAIALCNVIAFFVIAAHEP